MYTIRADKPVNPVLLEILTAVQAAAGELGCDYLLVGATARDIMMTHVFGLDARRATHDVDFAIALESRFTPTTDKVLFLPHHFKYQRYPK